MKHNSVTRDVRFGYYDQYVIRKAPIMAHPVGESNDGVLRRDFDRRLMLQLRGSMVASDAGLSPVLALFSVPLPSACMAETYTLGPGDHVQVRVSDFRAGTGEAYQSKEPLEGLSKSGASPLKENGNRTSI
jgi:hypothetical protein